jgi:site-specific DNA-cytosine methylase
VLYKEVMRLLGEFRTRPSYVFLENVAGITKDPDYKDLLGKLSRAGYDCAWDHYAASTCGALHVRRRWFLLGVRREPAPVALDCGKVGDPQLRALVEKEPFKFAKKQSAILPAFREELYPQRRQAVASMEMLGNAVVPAQANMAFRGLLARMQRLRTDGAATVAEGVAGGDMPMTGLLLRGRLMKLEADPENAPKAPQHQFRYRIQARRGYRNRTPLRTGSFTLNYLGTPRRRHGTASAPSHRAFADFGTTVAFCEVFNKGENPRSATVKHGFAELVMGFPENWTRSPEFFKG